MHAHIYLYSGNGYGNAIGVGMEMKMEMRMRMRVGLCGRLTQSGDPNISRSSNKLHTSGLEGERWRGGRLSGILTVGRTFFLINLCGMRYGLENRQWSGEAPQTSGWQTSEF